MMIFINISFNEINFQYQFMSSTFLLHRGSTNSIKRNKT